MFSFLNTSSELFNRGVQFNINDYVFCINCVLGENPLVSYAIAYDAVGFKKVLGTEDEETFVKSKICPALLISSPPPTLNMTR